MLRGLILVALVSGVAFLMTPFVLASRQLDARGITIQGRVHHKSEYTRIRYSTWERTRDVSVEYPVPETGGVSFFSVHPDEQHYDALHTNQVLPVRYLLRRDIPNFPMAAFWWELHALPTIRLANDFTPSVFTAKFVMACEALGGLAVFLLLWRITRWSGFAWAAGIEVVAGLGLLIYQDFPRPTPAPAIGVRRASGRVSNMGRIDKLFSGARERGVDADQPVDVVSIEFVPEGRTEPVVAVDLIDRGSVAGLKEQSIVPIRYEAGSPRVAYIEGAARTFPQRNLSGAVLQGVMGLAVLLGLFAGAHWIGKAFKKLIAR
jgi:hypothetical protein